MFSGKTYATTFSLKYNPITLLDFFKLSILFNCLTFALSIDNYICILYILVYIIYYKYYIFLKFIETFYKNIPVSTGSTITVVQ